MQIIYSIIIILLLSGCQSTSKDPIIEVPENTAEYLYNIQINGFQIINETVRNGQNVGEILNQHNISFVDIDKVARLSKKVFDLRDVKQEANTH